MSRRTFVAGIAGLVLIIVAASACQRRRTAEEVEAGAPVEAKVAPVREAPWPSGLSVTASVEPFRRAMPGTVLMGRVVRIERREGDVVRAGEVLARVDSRDVAARQAQAEAQLAAALAAEENARRMRERMERLVARQAASQKNLEDATLGHESARAALQAAEEGVAAARVYTGYAAVTAPFAGVVTERTIEVGDMASPGMPLFTVEDLTRVKIEAAVSDLSQGSPVEVEIGAAGEVRTGTLTEILPAADPRSRTFTVRIVIDNPGRALRPGMFARLRLGTSEQPAVVVPASSIVRRGPLTGVFVADDSDVARLRWITLGSSRKDRLEVLTGLAAGERVVVDPPADLKDGRRIVALPAETL